MSTPPDCQELDRLLVEICRLHYTRAHALFETIGLYRGQPPLLRILTEQEGLAQRELADLLGVKPATISKMLERMERAGFLERRPDPKDQRVSRVYLTAQGRAVQDQVRGLLSTIAQETFAGLTPEERALLHGFLARVRQNLVQVTGEPRPC